MRQGSGLTLRFRGSRCEEFAGGDPQRDGEFLDNCDCWIALAPLDVAYVRSVDAGAFGIVLLRPAFAGAQVTDVSAKALPDIHIDDVPPTSTINLQTMSDN